MRYEIDDPDPDNPQPWWFMWAVIASFAALAVGLHWLDVLL